MSGRVVDPSGAPVAGATVAVGALEGDSLAVAVTFHPASHHLRTVTTDASGNFHVSDAFPYGYVVAQHDTLRSRPAQIRDHVELALAPTRRIEGHIELQGASATNAMVTFSDADAPAVFYRLDAPVTPDGRFAVSGVPAGHIKVTAGVSTLRGSISTRQVVDTRRGDIRGLALAIAASHRIVHVLVRSALDAPLSNARIVVIGAKLTSTTDAALARMRETQTLVAAQELDPTRATAAVMARSRMGDLHAIADVPAAPAASACALSMPRNDLIDAKTANRILSHYDQLRWRCVPIPEDAEVVVVEIPPLPRFDH